MSRFSQPDRSPAVAIWLFSVAFLVFAMVVVGGVTRLTGSGLSITEWKPILGAVPPLNTADWERAFALYRQIPQYSEVNAGMTLEEFKGIYWWEWIHRQLGRFIGLAFALPFVAFVAFRRMPTRLIWRCGVLFALGALQGGVGWWMVSSGLVDRIDVAPERLTAHLGLALLIFGGLVWTALEALEGEDHSRSPAGWSRGAIGLLVLVFLQCLLGGLVAGTDAGRVFNDWPTMGGAWLPPVDWSRSGWGGALHDQGLVQFAHRIGGYLVVITATVFAVRAYRLRQAEGVTASAYAVAAAAWVQMGLGVATLLAGLPVWLAALHQAGAVVVLGLAVLALWRVRRSQPRLFMSSGIGSRGL